VEQVVGGKTGFLVDAMDADAITKNMAHLLDHPDEAAAMGQKGHEHVRDNFLLPELVRRYLVLLRFYTGIDRELPAFRLNGLSYSEVISVLRSRHPDLESANKSIRAS
jgi:trehalose synthase